MAQSTPDAKRPPVPAKREPVSQAAHTNPANRLPANTRHRNGMRGKAMKC